MSRLNETADIAKSIDARWVSVFNRLVDENGEPRKKISPPSRARIEDDLLKIIREIPDLIDVNKRLRRTAREMRVYSAMNNQ